MPGKGHVPDLIERLIRGQRAGTSRTAGGFARGASPQMVRDRMAASLKGGGLTSTVQRSSMIDVFEIVDDADSAFTLSHTPLFDSWNVSLSWSLVDGADYGITGKTLTVTDPTDLFRGIADNGPRTLQVQYDYLTGVPTSPHEAATFPQSKDAGPQSGFTSVAFDSPPAAGSSAIYFVENRFSGFQGGGVSGLGATWTLIDMIGGGTGSGDARITEVWLGTGCDGSSSAVTSVGDDTLISGVVEVSTPLTAAGAVTDTPVSSMTAGPITAPGAGIAVQIMNGIGAGGVVDTPILGWVDVIGARHARVAPVGSGDTVEAVAAGSFAHAVIAVVKYA